MSHQSDYEFALALQLSDNACELDYEKNRLNATCRAAAVALVLQMHHVAHLLAGARAVEIYGKEEATS